MNLVTTSTRCLAWNINIRSRCWITNPGLRVTEVFCRGRGRDEIINSASLGASCDISISGSWLALMGSQCWGCDAHCYNCSAKNQLCDICHDFFLRDKHPARLHPGARTV